MMEVKRFLLEGLNKAFTEFNELVAREKMSVKEFAEAVVNLLGWRYMFHFAFESPNSDPLLLMEEACSVFGVMLDREKDLEYYCSLPYKNVLSPIPDELGGGWEAFIPELGKEVFRAWGETPEEALTSLEELKRDIFERYLEEGVEIPLPKEKLKTGGKR